jgi:hypothetical protein
MLISHQLRLPGSSTTEDVPLGQMEEASSALKSGSALTWTHERRRLGFLVSLRSVTSARLYSTTDSAFTTALKETSQPFVVPGATTVVEELCWTGSCSTPKEPEGVAALVFALNKESRVEFAVDNNSTSKRTLNSSSNWKIVRANRIQATQSKDAWYVFKE